MKEPHPKRAFEILTARVRISRTRVEAPGIAPLDLARGFTLRGFKAATDRMLLVQTEAGRVIELWVGWKRKVAIGRKRKRKGGKKVYNDAAIFVTKDAGTRVVSGGLPSLGKRR